MCVVHEVTGVMLQRTQHRICRTSEAQPPGFKGAEAATHDAPSMYMSATTAPPTRHVDRPVLESYVRPILCVPAQNVGNVAQAVLEYGKAPYKPHSSAAQVVWFWNEVGELAFGELPKCRSLGQAWRSVAARAQLLLSSVDAVLDPADPLPFLALHYQQVAIPKDSFTWPYPRPPLLLQALYCMVRVFCLRGPSVSAYNVRHRLMEPILVRCTV